LNHEIKQETTPFPQPNKTRAQEIKAIHCFSTATTLPFTPTLFSRNFLLCSQHQHPPKKQTRTTKQIKRKKRRANKRKSTQHLFFPAFFLALFFLAFTANTFHLLGTTKPTKTTRHIKSLRSQKQPPFFS
jgi:cobalamin-dependent methionine synthase I